VTGDAAEVLRSAKSVLLVDWPSREVPEALVRAGYAVAVKSGPGPDDFSAWDLDGDEIRTRATGRRPEHADLVYAHRPVAELPGIAALAREVGASTIWLQSGLADGGEHDPRGCWLDDDSAAEARRAIESAGLVYLAEPYIADAVRML